MNITELVKCSWDYFAVPVHDYGFAAVFFTGGIYVSYQINYDPSRRRKFYTVKHKKIPSWILAVACIALAATIFHNELKNFLIPGDPQITSAAFSSLTEDLQAGESFKNAVTAFCREIIDGAATAN